MNIYRKKQAAHGWMAIEDSANRYSHNCCNSHNETVTHTHASCFQFPLN